MSNTIIDYHLCLANAELNKRIALLEESLLKKEKAAMALEDSEKRYRRLFESARDGILILDADTGMVVDVNPFLIKLLDYSHDEFRGKHIWEIGAFKDIAVSKEAFKTLQDNEYIRYEDLPLKTSGGHLVEVEFVSNVYLVDHSKVIQCNIRDITEHKRAAAEHQRLMMAIEQSAEAIVMTDAHGNIQFINPAFERTTGYSRHEIIGRNPRIIKSDKQDETFYRNLWGTIAGGRTWEGRMVNKRKDGTLFTEESSISPVCDPAGRIVSYVSVKRNISEQIRLAAQFRQAQKMEAVGLLAGGVAHDYNNMLSVILGFTELALDKIDSTHPLHADLMEILTAAGRSADITRQLLAFARKQTISPVVLDLNQNMESMLKMIRRLIGEDIHLAWLPGAKLWMVKMDPSQIDQILANLCVNARDAIANVGRLTIETENTVIDETYCAVNAGFAAGEYVQLSVSDDGSGMDKETLDQIFEPFFTSKGVGHGTGLGLSTVYGIVKQNNGFINVYSEQGNGTTFRIYLPRYLGQTVDTGSKMAAEIPQGQGETILVMEDEIAILKLLQIMLQKLGYRVLATNKPSDAIQLAAEHSNEIQLLISDVVMPEMNGRDLAERVQSLCPGIKALYMSGYTATVIAQRGVLDDGVNFIKKPFSMSELAIKIRQSLS